MTNTIECNYDVQPEINITYTWVDSDVTVSTLVIAAMLEVRYTTLQQCNRCNGVNLRIWLQFANCCVWNYTLVIKALEFSDVRIFTHFMPTSNVPPTWRRGLILSLMMSLYVMYRPIR